MQLRPLAYHLGSRKPRLPAADGRGPCIEQQRTLFLRQLRCLQPSRRIPSVVVEAPPSGVPWPSRESSFSMHTLTLRTFTPASSTPHNFVHERPPIIHLTSMPACADTLVPLVVEVFALVFLCTVSSFFPPSRLYSASICTTSRSRFIGNLPTILGCGSPPPFPRIQ